jgi:uncharacterized surface protein with fasciclin (FAS1) repeats
MSKSRRNSTLSTARRWSGAVAAAALTLASSAAMANSGITNYFNCMRTQPVDFPGTIVDAAVATPALSTLVSLVSAAGLVPALSAPGNLTVYAPTNDAFAKIPGAVLGAIGGDNAVLTAVLTYHVVAGTGDPRVLGSREAPTLQGQTVFLKYDNAKGTPRINQSTTSCQAVRTTNGTVWVIDSVLLPQFR